MNVARLISDCTNFNFWNVDFCRINGQCICRCRDALSLIQFRCNYICIFVIFQKPFDNCCKNDRPNLAWGALYRRHFIKKSIIRRSSNNGNSMQVLRHKAIYSHFQRCPGSVKSVRSRFKASYKLLIALQGEEPSERKSLLIRTGLQLVERPRFE